MGRHGEDITVLVQLQRGLGTRSVGAIEVHRDQRGIALQTVIIMVALIAVAMAVSAVILTRGGDVADDLERQNVTFDPSRFRTEALCLEYGYSWDTTDSANPVCVDP